MMAVNMIIDKKIIVSGFAVAADSGNGLDDAYSGDGGDCFVYYNSQTGKWGNIDSAEITNNEYQLVKMLEYSTINSKSGYKPFPITITTTISSLNSEKFDGYLTQLKRERALKKLTEEDMVVLGLMGEKE